MKDENGCIEEFQGQYKTFLRGKEDKIWQDRCPFGFEEELVVLSFLQSVISPISGGKPSRYTFCPRSSSTEESSALSDHWKNIYFAARCLIETIVFVTRRAEGETACANEKALDGTFQQYEVAAQQHVLMIQQFIPNRSYFTIVQRTVDVVLLQMLPAGASANAIDNVDRLIQHICEMLGSQPFIYKVVQYDSSICTLRLQQVNQVLLASSLSSNQDTMSSSIMELDARAVVTAAADPALQPTAHHRGLFLYLLSQLYALRHDVSSRPPEWEPNRFTERGILDALMALLYKHLSTVRRIDFMVLLNILYLKPGAARFPTTRTNEPRDVTDIQCLLCIESMALWYIVNQPASSKTLTSVSGDSQNILSKHPFFCDLHLANAVAGRSELEEIVQFLRTLWTYTQSSASTAESFSLIAFSFGLLLYSVSSAAMSEMMDDERLLPSQQYWKTLSDVGMDFITQSNLQYNPMQYLCQIMSVHVASSAGGPDIPAMLLDSIISKSGSDQLNSSVPLLTNTAYTLDNNTRLELSSAALLYAHIGREVLISTIYLFPSSLFFLTSARAKDEETLIETIGLLSSTMQAIFCNSPTLSQLFWSDWNLFLTDKENKSRSLSRKETPQRKPSTDCNVNSASVSLCRLLDVSQHLAISTLVSQEQALPTRCAGQRNDPELLLMKLVPTLQIVSAVVYHPKMLERLFSEAIVPPSLISTILNLVSTTSAFSSLRESAVNDYRAKFVVSLSMMSNVASTSAECRMLLRRTLEGTVSSRETNSLESTLGCVSNLISISTMSYRHVVDGDTMAFHIWNILANIVHDVDDTPIEWIFAVTRAFQVLQDPKHHDQWHRWFLSSNSGDICNSPSVSVLRVLLSAIGQLSNIAFSRDGYCSDDDTDAVISTIGTTVLSFLSVLPLLSTTGIPLSNSANEYHESTSPYLTVTPALVMNSVSQILQHLLPIAKFHKSDTIKSVAFRTFNDVLYSLSSKGGVREVIAQHVINPFLVQLFEYIDVSMELRDYRVDRSIGENKPLFLAPPFSENLPEFFAGLLEQHLSHISPPDLINDRAEGSWNAAAEGELTVDCRFVTSLIALRLLNIWSDSINDGSIKLDEGRSPCNLLGIIASGPTTHARAHPFFALPSRANQLMVWSLLLRQLIALRRGCTIESIFAIESFKFLSAHVANFRGMGTNEARSDEWSKDMAYSTVFASAMATYWRRVNGFFDQKNEEILEFDVVQQFLLFFEAMADAFPFAAISVWTKDGSSVTSFVLEATAEVASTLSNEKESSKFDDSFFAFKVELVTSFLRIISLLRRTDRGMVANSHFDEFKNIVKHDKLLLRSLSSCVLLFAQVQGAFVKKLRNVNGGRLRNIFLRFVAAALNLLSQELLMAQESSSLNDDSEVVRAVSDALRSNVQGIAQATKELARFETSILQSFESFSKYLIAQSSFLPLEVNGDQLLTVAGSNEATSWSRNESTKKAIYQWLVLMNKSDGGTTRCLVEHFTAVNEELIRTQNQLSCLNSWKSFVYILVVLLKKSKGSSPDSPLFQVSRSSLMQNVAIEVLRNFHESLNLFALSPVLPSSVVLQEFSLQMSKCLSGLLVICGSMKEVALASTQNEWLESLCRLRDILKLVSSNSHGSDVFRETMSELIVTASVLVDSSLGRDALSSDLFENKGRIESISLDIVSIASQMLSALERETLRNEAVVRCFSTCVLLLSSFTERWQSHARDAGDRNASFTAQLCEVFQRQCTIQTLLRQVQMHQHEPVLLVLGLLTKMASLGDAAILTLLMSCAGTLFKPLYPLPISQHDERHPIWLAQLNLIGSCVWSARSNRGRSEPSSERCRRFAESFLAENQSALLGCLTFCSTVEFGPNASRDNKFSSAILREAKFIVSIVSGLYCRDAMNDVRLLENSVLFQVFTLQATSLTVSLATFLGASAMARDLFSALNDDQVTDVMLIDQGADPMRHGPLYRVLSNGLQNAKHEAIRFASHFVLNCMEPVSSEDKRARQTFSSHGEYANNENVNGAGTESSSISELEQQCRSGITNLFAYQLELEAAECLTHVMKVLYSTHPASSSFLQVTADQPRRVVWSMVVPGTVIAYYDEEREAAGPCLKLTKVLRCDSINRRWFVQFITDGDRVTFDKSQREGIVEEAQLVGLEDRSRRVPILSFLGAPETSSDLEKISRGPALSIGHLILILRWCCQFQKEMLSSADILASHDDGRFTSISVRLAEVVSLVLGLDLSIHRETSRLPLFLLAEDPSLTSTGIPTPSTVAPVESTNTMMILADQILDLFGETGDFASSLPHSEQPRQGRLHAILSTDAWQQARAQLHSYVQFAAVEQHRDESRPPRGSVGPMMIAGGKPWGR